MAQPARQTAPGSEGTRGAILQAAERLFAEKGFDKGRLEDVAEAVGIRRASIVYYFKDKPELYDAVLAGVFGDFLSRLDETLSAPGTVTERIEAAVSAWVDYVAERPTFARILLREVANGTWRERPAALPHIQPFYEVVERFVATHAGDPVLATLPIDPTHMAATVAGATVFFVAAIPTLAPGIGFDPLSDEHLEAHRAEVLKITRRLMGTVDLEARHA